MSEFYQSTGFVISFLILTLAINMALGTEVTNAFLTLVLFSMIILQADKFINFLERSF